MLNGVRGDAIWIEQLGPDDYRVDPEYERLVAQLDKLFESKPFAVIASSQSPHHPDFDIHPDWVE
jgi:hypothetical protein